MGVEEDAMYWYLASLHPEAVPTLPTRAITVWRDPTGAVRVGPRTSSPLDRWLGNRVWLAVTQSAPRRIATWDLP